MITLLSSSPSLSRRAQNAMKGIFSLQSEELGDGPQNDELDSRLKTPVPMFRKYFDSAASRCPNSGTIIHLLAVANLNGEGTTKKEESLQLLSISSGNDTDAIAELVGKSRALIASRVTSFSTATTLTLKHSSGQKILPSDLLGFGGGLPLLDFEGGESSDVSAEKTFLREVAIPFFYDSAYEDGSTIQSKLSKALKRPVVGLYQLHNGLALRPLPAAKEDRHLPGPSMVFQCENIEEAKDAILRNGAKCAKIGFSGTSKMGQLIALHPDLPGLDLRLDDSPQLSSSFSEAQDALLAGSLDELQNANVLLEGGKGTEESKGKTDTMNGLGDCWVEFRANMKAPSGYIQRNSNVAVSKSKGNKVAKLPDLPYE